ncbi:trypsin-like serine peptidase [Streptomyces pinistramenti]|uniref:trypsin-like serine peptidase n=1 Tax=Streptomyces pinistramenti TaxID=2884812 RepID=UPI001D0896D2|nr:trypsin-like peptidase domain-containing protein [Streptomyces pinistramenti]MCB5908344.1 trypsin-like peptidase domain-containing protein [Streptomyces pinistramenti]
MRRILRLRAATLGACASLALTTPAAAAPQPDSGHDGAPHTSAPAGPPSTPSPAVTQDQIHKARETERYWTPERIDAAVPLDAPQADGKGADGTDEQPAPGARRKRSLAEPSHPRDTGIATVGVFLIRGADGAATPNQFCSASAVASPTKSLVITAAHCLKGDRRNRDIAFVPGYRAGASKAGGTGETPYGIFPVQPGKIWTDKRYLQSPADDDVDFAFLRVGPNSDGKLLEDATGPGNRLTAVPAAQLARKDVTVAGYPGGRKTPLQCTNDTRAFQGRFMEIQCDAFRAGVSGGPFLEHFDGDRGDLVGVIGGYKTGGLYDHTSYASQFDDDVFRLYDQAVNDTAPDLPNPMGNASTWKNARVMTAGRFHTDSVRNGTDDLIVRWSDGEVSLYPGDGAYGFRKDVRLTPANETWKHAAAITAGDFTGDHTYDLLVRWNGGSLTLYKDVNETNKLRNAIKLQPASTTWKHAEGMTTGRFGGATSRADDLVVRWSDGEVTLYPDVDAKGLHAEKQLAKPNKTWTYARDLTAGDFGTGTGGQDLFVRWTDGEVSVYADLAGKGLASEHRLRPAKSAWRYGSLSTAGTFGGNTRQDDIVTLWPGSGKLTMNTGTTLTSLAGERTLVPTS